MVANPSWLGAAGNHHEEMQRALTVTSAGSILVQTLINRVVQALTLRYLGVISTLDHRPGSGPSANINRRAPGTTSAQWLDDTTEPDEDTGTYTQATFTYRTAVSRGRVTRKQQAIGRSYADNLAQEMMFKTEDHVDILENGYVQGNSAANSAQINGLLTLVNGVTGQQVANTTANVGVALVLGKLDETIDIVRGGNADKLIFCSQKGGRLINGALQAQQRFVDSVEIAGGFRVMTYQGIPIIQTTQMPDTLVWNGTAAKVTAFTGGTSTALAVVNRNAMWIEDLTPTSVLPLAKTSSQFDQFDVFTDTVLVLANTKGAALLGGLA